MRPKICLLLACLIFCTSAQIGYLYSAYNLIDNIMEDFFADSFKLLFGTELSSIELTLLWSFCVALKPIGQIVGCLTIGGWKIPDRIGRARTLLSAAIIGLVGVVLQVCVEDVSVIGSALKQPGTLK